MTTNFTDYLRAIETELQLGNATENTHRPVLKVLVDSFDKYINVTNEPRHIACGAPDFSISRQSRSGTDIIGYIETKDVGASLDQAERSPQLKRYLAALRNLILTDYLEFRWYVDGQIRRTIRLANWNGSKLTKTKGGPSSIEALFGDFLTHTPQEITSPAELAQRLARLALLIRESIVLAFEQGHASNLLQGWRKAFAEVLIADLNQPEKVSEFADMFSQTLAYGLFSARIMDISPGFSLAEAQRLIPKTNPFLRRFFSAITGPDLDDEPFVGYVTDLVALLDHTDIHAVLADFGKRTKQDDPTVHFYETFLAAYDPKLRQLRGVYYTPQPVVSFIVRAIDDILKTRFGLKDGLADSATVTFPDTTPGALKGAKKTRPKVLILDPATGTATFPYTVIDHIRQTFMQRNNAGLWNGYVSGQLLPRLFAFELLMAPYAVAHFKLALQLAAFDLPDSQRKDWAYHFTGDERLNVFLTNTLDQPHEWTGLPLFTQFLADETIQANQVKQEMPIMVILGNPPYSVESANTGKWITDLVKKSYYPHDEIREANPKMLLDDYVKFIRWGQWKIENNGNGILGFITNHSYLDSPLFRTMRQSLLTSFNEIYILNLHGNSKQNEVAPDGSKDENVFDIQQGVSISIFIRTPENKSSKIYYCDLWGSRTQKYTELQSTDIKTISWRELIPAPPFFLFTPQENLFQSEYGKGRKISEIFPVNSVGLYSARDDFAVDFSMNVLWERIQEFIKLPIEVAREKYKLGEDARDWKVKDAQSDIKNGGPSKELISVISYRPFDTRYTYFTGRSGGFICMPRPEVMSNMRGKDNIALCFVRRCRGGNPYNFFVVRNLVDKSILSSLDNANVAPLYLYKLGKNLKQELLTSTLTSENPNEERIHNLGSAFCEDLYNNLRLGVTQSWVGDLNSNAGPEDVLHYIYAIFHSPTYRTRYNEFFKIDFPRVPLTHNINLFRALCSLGAELVGLHLLESPKVKEFITSYPIPGDNCIEKGFPKYNDQLKRVYINASQYFDGILPKVWEFHIGGYQVLDKWLKDRRGRLLTFEDLIHYQSVVVALAETIRLMEEIDRVIPAWPIP